jgi:hypothetical protein
MAYALYKVIISHQISDRKARHIFLRNQKKVQMVTAYQAAAKGLQEMPTGCFLAVTLRSMDV